MSPATVDRPEVDPLADPLKWFWSWLVAMFVYGIAMLVTALALAGSLYYTWPVVAGAFSFTNPISGYWTYTLLVLGAFVVYLVYETVRTGTMANILSAKSRPHALDFVGKALVLLLITYIIAEYVA
jgi:hypothetical protein